MASRQGRVTTVRAVLALGLIALALISALLGVWLSRRHGPSLSPRATVVFLDAGSGDCALIRTPEGRTILLDTGGAAAGPVVAATLRRLGLQTVDLLILASPEESSIGGVPAVLDGGLTVSQVWESGGGSGGAAWDAALAAVRKRHIPLRTAHAGGKLQIGRRCLLSVVWPPERGPRARADPLVCRLDYGETTFLFLGPCRGAAERYLVAGAGDRLGSTGDLILQVAAHGDDTGTSPELLRRAAPVMAVIPADPQRGPAPGTLHRLQAAGAEVWRTDRQGAITATTDGRGRPQLAAAH